MAIESASGKSRGFTEMLQRHKAQTSGISLINIGEHSSMHTALILAQVKAEKWNSLEKTTRYQSVRHYLHSYIHCNRRC